MIDHDWLNHIQYPCQYQYQLLCHVKVTLVRCLVVISPEENISWWKENCYLWIHPIMAFISSQISGGLLLIWYHFSYKLYKIKTHSDSVLSSVLPSAWAGSQCTSLHSGQAVPKFLFSDSHDHLKKAERTLLEEKHPAPCVPSLSGAHTSTLRGREDKKGYEKRREELERQPHC